MLISMARLAMRAAMATDTLERDLMRFSDANFPGREKSLEKIGVKILIKTFVKPGVRAVKPHITRRAARYPGTGVEFVMPRRESAYAARKKIPERTVNPQQGSTL